jgi:hypothetical protein
MTGINALFYVASSIPPYVPVLFCCRLTPQVVPCRSLREETYPPDRRSLGTPILRKGGTDQVDGIVIDGDGILDQD